MGDAARQNPPPPGPVGLSQMWASIVGAVFGGITLVGLFAFALIAGREPQFICNSFTLLGSIFAFGAALAAGFMGGAAGVSGRIPFLKDNVVAFSAVGGIAVFFIAFLIFQSFDERVCNYGKIKADEERLQKENGVLTDQIKAIQEEPFVFRAENIDAILKNVVLKYMDKYGEYRKVRANGHTFTIDRADVGDLDEGFSLEADFPEPLSKRPIALERIVPGSSRWRMSLFLSVPSIEQTPK
jgi:hypothetical protein